MNCSTGECKHENGEIVVSSDGKHLVATPPDLSNCDTCYGTGWRHELGEDNRAEVSLCAGGRLARSASRFNSARVPHAYEAATLDALRLSMRGSGPGIAVAAIGSALSSLAQCRRAPGLWLHGDNRCGKTFATCAILRHCALTIGAQARFYPVRQLLQDIRDTYSGRSATTEGEIVDRVSSVHVLALDDVRNVDGSSFEARVLADIVERRANGAGYLTVVTSNPDPRSFMRGDDWEARRIVSRLLEIAPAVKMPTINPKLTEER